MEKVVFLTATLAVANAGLLNHLLPPVDFNVGVHEEFHDPSYQFNYDVQDANHGSFHSQNERRTGDRVDGTYSLIEPDGHRRIVHYTSDRDVGFTAQVVREPTGHFVHHSPILPYQPPSSNEYLPPSVSPPSLPSPPQSPPHVPLPPPTQEPSAPYPDPAPPAGELPQLPLPPVVPSPPLPPLVPSLPPSAPSWPSLPPSTPSLPPAVYGPPAGELPQLPLPPVLPSPPLPPLVPSLPPSAPSWPSLPPSTPSLPPSVYGPPPAAPLSRLPLVHKDLSYSYYSSPHGAYLNYY